MRKSAVKQIKTVYPSQIAWNHPKTRLFQNWFCKRILRKFVRIQSPIILSLAILIAAIKIGIVKITMQLVGQILAILLSGKIHQLMIKTQFVSRSGLSTHASYRVWGLNFQIDFKRVKWESIVLILVSF